LTKKVALALTFDLFNVLLPLLCGTKSDFLGEKLFCWTKTAKLAESSETTVQRNSLRGRDPQVASFPNFFKKQVALTHLRLFKWTTQKEGFLQIQMESITPDL
jgi:hypothetical protein